MKHTIFFLCDLLLSIFISAQTTIIPYKSVWKYLDNGTNQGTAWRAMGFDDGTWKSGAAVLGYGTGDEATKVSFGPSSSNKYITTYFRKTINISDASQFSGYDLSVYRDDGVVVYVNGSEVYRSSMPTGTISYTTLAFEATDDGMTAQHATLPASAFVSGTNVIAVEIHQRNTTNSDIRLDLELIGKPSTVDNTAPAALSINRQSPSTEATSATSVTYRITFSEKVTGVDASDFTTSVLSGSLTSTIATLTATSEDSTAYDIEVNNISGTGILRLDLNNTGTNIIDTAGNAIENGFTGGQTYSIDQTPPPADNVAPVLSSVNRQSPATQTTSATSVTFRASFSEPVSSVDVSDFTINVIAGSLTSADIASVIATDNTNNTYDITINNINGSATIRLDLKSSGTGITDAAGNAIDGGFTSGETYIIDQAPPPPTDNTAPEITSIDRQSPTTQTTSATSVIYRASFTEKVRGVGLSDFVISVLSGSVTFNMLDVSATSADSTAYDITINNINGSGTLRLDLKGSGTGIVDTAGNNITGGFTSGETYIVDQTPPPPVDNTAPTITDIVRQNPLSQNTSSKSVVYRTSFSEKVKGIDASDFTTTVVTGSVTSNISSITAVSSDSTAFDVTLNNINGTGTIRLDLKNTQTGITDTAGNVIESGYTSGQTYIIEASTTVTSPVTFIPYKSVWKYLDNGTNQGTAWRAMGFDDGTWKSGAAVLGYGTGDEATKVSFGPSSSNKYITTYFRKTINISDASQFSGYDLSVYRDDGVVVYVNGSEVYRSSMPTGTISYTTLAFEATDDGMTAQHATLPASAFVSGTNVIAVEIHQRNTTNSDIRLDLELIGKPSTVDNTAPAALSINRQSPSTEATSATSVTYRITFSEKVTGVDASDFTTSVLSGSLTSGSISTVADVGTDGMAYDVTIDNINGSAIIRLDLKSSGTGIMDASGNAIAGGFTTGESYTIEQISQTQGEGFASIKNLDAVTITKNTADKPQSKVWTYNGKWWTVLSTSTGTKIYRLDGSSWTPILTLTSATNVKADCRVVGNVTHILLFRGTSTSYLASVEYDSGTDKYKRWSKRTSNTNITFESGVETATLALDSDGKMWIASDATSDIRVRWSNSPYSSISSPIIIGTGITSDDICAITPMQGKVGVLWSNQNSKHFAFKTHTNGDANDDWSADEAPGASAALNIGTGMADDHLSIVNASDGTVYCAVKTSYDKSGYTRLGLLIRRPTGSWDKTFYKVTSGVETRPIVILNESRDKLKVIYSSEDGGGNILYRETSTSSISFSDAKTLMNNSYAINNVTSTHQTYSNSIVIMASRDSPTPLQAYSVLASDVSTASITSAQTQTMGVDVTTSPAIQNEKDPFIAYPNPFTNSTVVSFNIEAAGKYNLSLYSINGVLVKQLKEGWAQAGDQQQVTIDGGNIDAGVYLVVLKYDYGTRIMKLIRGK